MNLELLYVAVYSYILGSIPFGLVLTKIFLKKDIRKIGSGNIGATNVLRTGKKYLSVATLLFDMFKSYISVIVTLSFFYDYIYLSALLCILGHIFPIWLKFKGGKGIAVYLGVLFAFSIYLAFIFMLIWIIVLYTSKYSSLSSLISSLVIFFYSIVLNNFNMSLFFFIILIIVVYTHRENILRIKKGTENKTIF
jgi:glycerol-3-phosphate acyltransferase PlsY|tara:strand:- start:233 stop:814 length:582 start_codon:yes stop_codon:yes gene_type:complete